MTQGIVSVPSRYPVAATVRRLQEQVEQHGAAVFAVIDHAANAHRAGQEMPETQVLIFGDPAVGTRLMLAVPDIALDLPMRVLVRDDDAGGSVVTWQDPGYIAARYGVPEGGLKPFAAVAALVAAALGSDPGS
jgi:uncharacterized protein (DUF302 family)